MVLEELILLYYLRIISLIFILISLYFSYLFFYKDIESVSLNVIIEKNQNSKSIIDSNIGNLNSIEKFITKTYLSIHSKYLKKIHYGKFILPERVNLNMFLSTITKPSNFILKITIVEGWSKNQLNELLKYQFEDFKNIGYFDAFADTYFLHSYENFNAFYSKLKTYKLIHL